MRNENKINVLVIPDLFPEYKGDVKGIFLLDYLSSTEPYYENTVLVVRDGNKKGLFTEQDGSIKIVRLNIAEKKPASFLKPFYYWRFFRKGVQCASELGRFDIIHAHGSILSGTLALKISERLNIPFILTEHVGPFTAVSKSSWRKRWTKSIMEKADAVLCVSEHQKNEILEAGIQPKKIIVTYNPVDTKLFHPASENKLRHTILFAARLDEFKGGMRVLKAFHSLPEEFSRWKLTIAGAGEDLNALQNYLEKNSALKERVKLTGTMGKQLLAEEMRKADFFAFPSRHESFGLVVAEALSAGLPVVTTNKTAPKEFVSEKEGILVEPDDVEKIKEAMIKMIRSLDSYSADLLHKNIEGKFGFENFGKKLVDIYSSFLRKS